MGIVSLESYLANIYLCGTIKNVLRRLQDTNILFAGGYIEYLAVILFGILLSLIVNKMSKIIIERIKTINNLNYRNNIKCNIHNIKDE